MPSKADAAKAFNKQLRATAMSLGGLGGSGVDHRYGFACECGCGGTVRLTLTEYEDQGGAWLAGHRQP
jgi:hypothetical protein